MRYMGMEKRKGRGAKPRAAILFALWTLIAITLLSALAPLGPPLSRLTGSAFNPATSDVVLKVRAPATAQAMPVVRHDGDAAPPVALGGLFAVLIVALWRLIPMAFTPSARQSRLRPVLVRAHRARAPPAAF
ncbi:hypothetical protein [Sphingobium sp. CAP-1]|uniref:hypothetical protein n=1 Tax=Sphingobium sp. CAP-1 TaxID=2676077 RepID=UPI001E340C15|nr:hypothetical protein [Sphingobium sp. CAP-1]